MEGFANQISLIKENAWGTAGVPTKSVPVKESDGIQINASITGLNAIKTTAPKNKGFYKGVTTYEGGFALDAYPHIIGDFLNSAIGAETPSTVESGAVYKHTFVEGVAKPSLTIEQVFGTVTKRFAGFVVGSFKLSGKAGETIGVAISGQAKAQADATKISASYETTRPFNFADITVLSIGGTDIKAYVEDFEFEYTNGLTMFHGLGSVDPSAKYQQPSEVKGKITAYCNATTSAYIADLIANTEREIILTMVGAAVGSGSNNALTFTLSKCAFTKTDTKLSFDYNAISLEFEAREDSTNGLIKAELTNTIASY
jgi:hypothetical protein